MSANPASENNTNVNEVHISLDMNLDSLNGKWLEPTYKYVSLVRLVQNYCDIGNISQLVNQPTRIMYNGVDNILEKSCIDHVYTNAKYKSSIPIVTPFGGSDHDIISYTRYSKISPTNCPTKKGRSYKKFDPLAFLHDLQNVDWTNVLVCQDLNQAVETFTTTLHHIYDKHAPWKTFQKRKNYAPWVTEEMKNLMQERDYWKQIVKQSTSL